MTTHNSPEEIRRDIERTRAELSDNVNALGDGANPANVARRQVDKVKDGAASLKHRVFGDPHDPWDDGAVRDAQHAGVVLEARSELNANPKDDHDHPFGVWTLPPVRKSAQSNDPAARRLTAEERAAFDAIGESDRMTLRLRKPE